MSVREPFFLLPVKTCLWSDAVDGCWTSVDGIVCGWRVDRVVFVCVCLCFEVVMVAQTLNYDRIIHRCLSLSLFFIDESTFLHYSVMFMCLCVM